MSYDGLVRRLKSDIAEGFTANAQVREAINLAMISGQLPVDLAGILMNLFPADELASQQPRIVPLPPQTEDDEEDGFDEATLPHVVPPRENLIATDEDAEAEIDLGPEELAEARPAAPAQPPPPTDLPYAAGRPPMAPGVLPPAMSTPPLPPLPGGPQAALPAYDEVKSRVDDVVLSALIGDFRGLREARGDRSERGARADALDGLLAGYKTARFRSDARRAAKRGASEGVSLNKLDDFGAKRAGLGSILRDRFILDSEVGRGGMGVVYAAVDRRRLEAGSGQPYVALKLLNDEFRSNSDALRVLEAEARKAQSLAHPNIATVFDFDRDRSEIFIVMELLSGKPLSRHLAAAVGQAMPGHRVAAILKGICSALSYAHRQGVVHSDLKPGNIFIVGDDMVKLLDFGLATASAAGSFDVTALGGLTAAYASPEMFVDAPRDPRDDIFALGCIAYQLLSGAHPFGMRASNEAAETKLEPEPMPDLDPVAWETIRRALAFDRESRTPSVDEFFNGIFEG